MKASFIDDIVVDKALEVAFSLAFSFAFALSFLIGHLKHSRTRTTEMTRFNLRFFCVVSKTRNHEKLIKFSRQNDAGSRALVAYSIEKISQS